MGNNVYYETEQADVLLPPSKTKLNILFFFLLPASLFGPGQIEKSFKNIAHHEEKTVCLP